MNKPLVSFCVKFYNQREYVEPALRGAFAQTYRPLEIVISDDGSTDGSHELIQKLISEYRNSGGDIPILYNHNEKNLGNLGNWQKCCELAHGVLFVKADGDDISLPERSERIVSAWMADGCRSKIINHAAYRIDLYGHQLGSMAAPSLESPIGAMSAYMRDCYDLFSKTVDYPKTNDDVLYSWRVLCMGGGGW